MAWPLALGALAATVLAQGGRFSARLDVLTHFAPIWLAGASIALALAAFGPRGGRPALVAVSLLAVAGGALLVLPEVLSRGRDPRAAADAPGQLKLIQFNAWGQNAQTDAAAAWIVGQDPDLVILEEPGALRAKLAARGYHDQTGSRGAAILSKQPALRTYAQPASDGRPGFIASATFQDAHGLFTVVATHRYWPVRFVRERAQTADLDRVIHGLPPERTIVAGDFNSTPWSFARRREDRDWGLIRRTRALFTWPAARRSHNRLPAPFPWLPIDHVYAGRDWGTVKVVTGPELGSDHYPVVVTLAPAVSGAR
ncbi:MAG: endonuclease/exonuclease/phosphatase family protein [Alphaproteobacteria bacterium]|nr:endonuclease/exonuclease/phosphatase family protein [Alphaproteobacteria bacterium]MBU1512964.1 endonuclease/exonuclease/phosphatase family protein [Alphaproteobacteria bacterium]MBU2094862.1 endonuclease/exonuclease/phosphatase family protein [Alphaproteobacteria bacterium]MBU2152768.1 endonuclease/exonuclease/phosphatase family protein [Alphaproteobacteria bacterium]MBU2306323.1 endonuclease/exonuclease/phosphatase family protein [Alphaproteobacteria bacterium]